MIRWLLPAILFAAAVLVLLAVVLFRTLKAAPHDEFSRRKLAELAALPVGLEVRHTPNPGRAVRGGRSGAKYTWLHQTSVKALDEDVVISEFGAFVWHRGQWVFGTIFGRPFNADEFAEWYSCPQAALRKGRVATDPSNYAGDNVLRPQKTLWFYIGVTTSGKRVKGEAVAEGLAQIAE